MGENDDRQHKPSIIQALETVSEGISVLSDEGKFEYANQEYADLFKYNKEELIGQNMGEIGISDNPTLFQDEILPALKEKGEWKGITTCTRKDGTKFLAEHSISMTEEEGIVSAITDNTVHEVYQTLVRNFPDGGVAVFDRELDYIMAGGETAEWNEVTPSEAEGENIDTIYSDENLKTVKAHYKSALEGEANTFRIKSGNKWYMFRVIPLEDREGNVFSGMAISQDITVMKEREENLKEFNSMVGHDLKNPLNNAKAFTQLAKESEDKQDIQKVENSIDQAQRVLEEIESLPLGSEKVEKSEIELEHAFKQACDDESSEVSCQTESTTVYANPRLLIRLLSKLVENSIRHNEESIKVKIGALEDGFYYEDNGKGITGEEREKVLEKGYTTSETSQGLGLYMVKRIAAAHSWNVEVTESETGGARFEFHEQ